MQFFLIDEVQKVYMWNKNKFREILIENWFFLDISIEAIRRRGASLVL